MKRRHSHLVLVLLLHSNSCYTLSDPSAGGSPRSPNSPRRTEPTGTQEMASDSTGMDTWQEQVVSMGQEKRRVKHWNGACPEHGLSVLQWNMPNPVCLFYIPPASFESKCCLCTPPITHASCILIGCSCHHVQSLFRQLETEGATWTYRVAPQALITLTCRLFSRTAPILLTLSQGCRDS